MKKETVLLVWQGEYANENLYFITDDTWPDVNWDKVHHAGYEEFDTRDEDYLERRREFEKQHPDISTVRNFIEDWALPVLPKDLIIFTRSNIPFRLVVANYC